jgi:beta-lactam-binding protein with PASTA domain
VRVARETLVSVPDVSGMSGDDAAARLAAVGLEADVHRESGFLDPLVPGDALVCELRPAAGTKVTKRSTVTVVVAKLC